MQGTQFQTTNDLVRDWPQAIAKFAAGTPVMAIDNVQLLSEAKAHNPNVFTMLRHHVDGQHFDDAPLAVVMERARAFLESFVDATFMEHAPNVNAILGFNEFTDNRDCRAAQMSFLVSRGATFVGHDPQHYQQRLTWIQAINLVWAAMQAEHPDLKKIRLISVNAPPGNSIPIEYARIVADYGGMLGHHPYTAITDGKVRFDDGKWYSGRWRLDDEFYRANGLNKVEWIGTEAGAIYAAPAGNMGPDDGWRQSFVLDGDWTRYAEMLVYRRNLIQEWNAQHGNRYRGDALFLSGSVEGPWRTFELTTGELHKLAEMTVPVPPVVAEPLPPPPPPPPPPTGDIKGIDVSTWQGTMDWQKAKSAGVRFAFIRATMGLTGVDLRFAANRSGVQAAGIPHGFYHLFHNAADPESQAAHLAATIPHDTPLPPVVDAEMTDSKPADLADRLHRFLVRLEQLTGRRAIIYTARWWWNPYIGDVPWAKEYDLWVANYTTAAQPVMPAGWTTYRFWQYTSSGSGGAHGSASANIDLNRFGGNEAAWLAYLEEVKAEQPFDPVAFVIAESKKEQAERGIAIRPEWGFEQMMAARPGYAPVHNETGRDGPDGKRYIFRAAEDLTGKGPRIVLMYNAPWGSSPVQELIEGPFRLASPVLGIPMTITAGGDWLSQRTYDGVTRQHEGIDLRAVSGTTPVPIVAPAAGWVAGIRATDPGTGYGKYVRLAHHVNGETYYTWLAHLGSVAAGLAVGQYVIAGRLLGIAGSSGNSTGIHLHFGLEWAGHRAAGNLIAGDWNDPRPYLGL